MGFRSFFGKFRKRRRRRYYRPDGSEEPKEKSPLFLKLIEIYEELKIIIYVWLGLLAIVVAIDLIPWDKSGYMGNLLAEFHGLLLDVLVFVILIIIYDRVVLERRRKIAIILDEIEILRNMEDEVAKHKIIGFIKRLNKLGHKRIDLSSCYFRKASLEDLSLADAIFRRANLIEASLFLNDIDGADFTDAKLQNATLWAVRGKNVSFDIADLSNVTIKSEAYITDSSFHRANLTGANLDFVYFNGSNFENATLEKSTIEECDFRKANLESANLMEITLTNSYFDDAKLINANLRNALMKPLIEDGERYYNDFKGADLTGADLGGADLGGADFIGAKNLTIEQLSKARSLYKAKLDPEVEKQIREKYPHLLEKPKEDSDV